MKWNKRVRSVSVRSNLYGTGRRKSFGDCPVESAIPKSSRTFASIDVEYRVTGDTNKFPSLTERGLFLPGAGSEIRAGALNGLRRFTLEPSSNKNIQSIEKPSVKVEKGEEIRETQAPLEMKKTGALESRLKANAEIAKTSRQPRLSLEPNGRDWVMEFYDNVKTPLKIEDPKMNQNIFVRDNKSATLQISKKFNSLTLENCEGVNIVVDSVISAIGLIHCKKCQVQVLGRASSITIDQCQGINVYVSFESKSIEITSSQNAEINLHVPESKENKDNWIELAIPCQFVHKIKDSSNSLDTKVSDLYH